MNRLLLFSIVLVLFIFYGGKNVPKVMKDNKGMLLGIVGGLVLCSFLGMNLEGWDEQCLDSEGTDIPDITNRIRATARCSVPA